MSRPSPAPAAPTWTPVVLLGLLSIATMGGPLLIFIVLWGGERTAWPPDRPVEWWTFGLTIATYLALLTVCLAVGLVRWRRTVGDVGASRKKPRGAGQ